MRSRRLLERHYDRIHGLAWQLTGRAPTPTTSPRTSAARWSRRSAASAARRSSPPGSTASPSTPAATGGAAAARFGAFSEQLAVLVGLAARARRPRSLRRRLDQERDRPAETRARDTAVLVAGQQLTHAEAAAILGIAEATVAWRMHEVRRILCRRPRD